MFTAVKMKNDRVHVLNYFQVRDNGGDLELADMLCSHFNLLLSSKGSSHLGITAKENTSTFHALATPLKLILHWFSFKVNQNNLLTKKTINDKERSLGHKDVTQLKVSLVGLRKYLTTERKLKSTYNQTGPSIL